MHQQTCGLGSHTVTIVQSDGHEISDCYECYDCQALDSGNIQEVARGYQQRCKIAFELFPKRYSQWAKQVLSAEERSTIQAEVTKWAELRSGRQLDMGNLNQESAGAAAPRQAAAACVDDTDSAAAVQPPELDALEGGNIVADVEDDLQEVMTKAHVDTCLHFL